MAIAREVRAAGSELGSQLRNCSRCAAPIMRRRRSAKANDTLCSTCDQRERRAAYFRSYYEDHKDKILDKNRRWAKDNKTRIVQLRSARREKDLEAGEATRKCLDCETAVTRASRCRKCYIRYRYATDPAYRARRLATTRRWLSKRQEQGEPKRRTAGLAASLARSN